MAIKLSIYLKRTNQKLESWLKDNEIEKISDFLPRCAFLGLSADNLDVADVVQILNKQKEDEQKQDEQKMQQVAQESQEIQVDEAAIVPRGRKKKEQMN